MAVRKLLSHMSDTVSAGKLITLNLPAFSTINQIFLEFTNSGSPCALADVKSSISNIALLLNGEEYINISPSNLDIVYNTLGQQVGGTLVNVLPLLLGHLLYKLPQAEDTFAIGCEGFSKDASGNWMTLSNIQVQITCGGTITNVTDVKAYTERVDKGTGRNLTSATCKMLSYFQGFTSVGTSEVDTLPRDSNIGRLFTLAVPDATGVISSGEALVNNLPVFQQATIEADTVLVKQRGYNSVANVYNYSFTDGGTSDLLSMQGVTDMRFKTTFTTANTAGYTLVDCTIRSV